MTVRSPIVPYLCEAKTCAMPEIVIQYKRKKMLDLLLSLAQYMDFSVVMPEKKTVAARPSAPAKGSSPEFTEVGGVSMIKGTGKLDNAGMQAIFTDAGIDARKLRAEGWDRSTKW
jgi:hypothetical protein